MEKDQQQTSANNPESFLPSYVHPKDTQTATVKVSDPDSNGGKFYTYLVSGSDEIGNFEIRRRYNDFFYFRQALVKKWPGIYIPPIPQKKITVNKDTELVEIRRKFFDYFMKRIGKIKHIFTCPITQQFIRNKGVQMQKFYGSMQVPKYIDLVNQYKKVYEKVNLSQKNTQNIKNDIQGLGGFLKKAEKELEDLKDKVAIIVDARAGFTQNLNQCNSSLLPDYEKNIYSQYLPEDEKQNPQLIFVNNHKVKNNIENLKEASVINSFAVCLDNITYEILQVKAMEEALKMKQKYEGQLKDKQNQLLEKQTELSKLNSGKTTLKSFFSTKSKTDQIQKLEIAIPDIEKEISLLEEFNNMLTIIFGTVELPIFKKYKQIQYYRMMYEISQNEIKYMAAYGQLMKSVLQGLVK